MLIYELGNYIIYVLLSQIFKIIYFCVCRFYIIESMFEMYGIVFFLWKRYMICSSCVLIRNDFFLFEFYNFFELNIYGLYEIYIQSQIYVRNFI